MTKKIIQHVKGNNRYYVFSLMFFFIGIFLTLSIDSVRYTQYVEPKMVEMDPRIAYQEMLNDKDGYSFFDVRSIGEYENLHASSSTSVPIVQLYDKWHTLPRSKDHKIYLICTSGRLAAVAYGYLQLHGFTNIVHITGGVQNWTTLNVPVVAKPIFLDKNFTSDKPVELPAPIIN